MSKPKPQTLRPFYTRRPLNKDAAGNLIVAHSHLPQSYMPEGIPLSDHIPMVYTPRFGNGKSLNIMTWNIMGICTDSSQNGGFSNNPFNYTENGYNYTHRLDQQKAFILNAAINGQLDFINLQEAIGLIDENGFIKDMAFLGALQTYGYGVVAPQKANNLKPVLTIYNGRKFVCKGYDAEIPGVSGKNTVMVASFTEHASGENLLIGNSHIEYNRDPALTRADFARICSATLMTCIVGDMNICHDEIGAYSDGLATTFDAVAVVPNGFDYGKHITRDARNGRQKTYDSLYSDGVVSVGSYRGFVLEEGAGVINCASKEISVDCAKGIHSQAAYAAPTYYAGGPSAPRSGAMAAAAPYPAAMAGPAYAPRPPAASAPAARRRAATSGAATGGVDHLAALHREINIFLQYFSCEHTKDYPAIVDIAGVSLSRAGIHLKLWRDKNGNTCIELPDKKRITVSDDPKIMPAISFVKGVYFARGQQLPEGLKPYSVGDDSSPEVIRFAQELRDTFKDINYNPQHDYAGWRKQNIELFGNVGRDLRGFVRDNYIIENTSQGSVVTCKGHVPLEFSRRDNILEVIFKNQNGIITGSMTIKTDDPQATPIFKFADRAGNQKYYGIGELGGKRLNAPNQDVNRFANDLVLNFQFYQRSKPELKIISQAAPAAPVITFGQMIPVQPHPSNSATPSAPLASGPTMAAVMAPAPTRGSLAVGLHTAAPATRSGAVSIPVASAASSAYPPQPAQHQSPRLLSAARPAAVRPTRFPGAATPPSPISPPTAVPSSGALPSIATGFSGSGAARGFASPASAAVAVAPASAPPPASAPAPRRLPAIPRAAASRDLNTELTGSLFRLIDSIGQPIPLGSTGQALSILVGKDQYQLSKSTTKAGAEVFYFITTHLGSQVTITLENNRSTTGPVIKHEKSDHAPPSVKFYGEQLVNPINRAWKIHSINSGNPLESLLSDFVANCNKFFAAPASAAYAAPAPVAPVAGYGGASGRYVSIVGGGSPGGSPTPQTPAQFHAMQAAMQPTFLPASSPPPSRPPSR